MKKMQIKYEPLDIFRSGCRKGNEHELVISYRKGGYLYRHVTVLDTKENVLKVTKAIGRLVDRMIQEQYKRYNNLNGKE